MIKRRFYRHEHGEGDDASDSSSSSSSDSELEAEATEETEAEEDDVAEAREYCEAGSSSSGYESEDRSANELNVDSSGSIANDDDDGTENDGKNVIKSHSSRKSDTEIVDMLSMAEKDSAPSDVGCILKCKSVFKCRLCPRIVCLTEESLKGHLKSKRHARSEKLLGEGRLKLMLNSDGEIEGEGETHAERHARIVAATTQNSADSGKKNKGRQRQRKRLKKKTGKDSNSDKARRSTKSPAKKRRKSEH
ncbi:Protein IQ-DOMAIN like [Actinidia chinensis var. chinensis]|uniref:Protein IQ-DOMAIN like n=1 Tax=Actinidia chinensis var. chinensis TaxID=1590841 RepID=A0A2R6RUA0_ACTCC|nr:Protein IQ-DOMAIN like [Actinidia chinensis var. chinensis]